MYWAYFKYTPPQRTIIAGILMYKHHLLKQVQFLRKFPRFTSYRAMVVNWFATKHQWGGIFSRCVMRL